MVIRCAAMGTAHGRNSIQRHRRAGRRVRSGGEQADSADTQHLSRALECADGR